MLAEPATEPLTVLGEGPVWDASRGRLVWLDMLRGDVLATEPGTSLVDRLHVGSIAACVVPRTGGGYAVATKRAFALVDRAGDITRLPTLWDDRSLRMNDGACDPAGRFYCGSMSIERQEGHGALYRLDPDLTVHRVLEGVTLSNGLGFSPDASIAYYIDSETQRLDVLAFDADAGSFADRRPVVQFQSDEGTPDGLTVDREGGVWVALWRGGVVRRYTPEGVLDAVVELPVTQPTSCVFGGDALDELYITTSALDLAEGAEPDAGSVFVVRPGVAGLPTNCFAG